MRYNSRLLALPAVFGAAASSIVLAACAEPLAINCPDGGGEFSGFSVVVEITDSAGSPAVVGTTVRLVGAGEDITYTGTYPDEDIVLLGDRSGDFVVTVSRPWWRTVTFDQVSVAPPTGECGRLTPARLTAELDLLPGAPPVRQVVPEVPQMSVVSDPPYTGSNTGLPRLRAFVEADAEISPDVDWTSADHAIATVDADGFLSVTCRETPIDTQLTVVSRADPTISATVDLTVARTSLWECPGG